MSIGLNFMFIILSVILKFITSETYKPLSTISNITPQTGYVSDLSINAPKQCYNPSSIIYTNIRNDTSLDKHYRYLDLIKLLNIDPSNTDSYEYTYETTHLHTYLNKIEDNDFSYSINYFSIISKGVNLTYHNSKHLLTQEGLEEYDKNSSTYFRLNCGDRVIQSYEIGLGMLFAIKLSFSNSKNKVKFLQNTNNIYNSLTQAVDIIEFYSRREKIRGYLELYGLQLNSKDNFLNSKVKGYLLCKSNSLYSISEQCKEWIKFLDSYMKIEFPLQANKFMNINLINASEFQPLIRYVIGDYVKDLGINDLSNSFNTPEILSARSSLVKQLQDYKYILAHLDNILELSPYKPSEVSTYKGQIKTFIASLNENNRTINCIKNIENTIKCANEILESIGSIDGELNKFLANFNTIHHFVFRMTRSFCLPKLLTWEQVMIIDINLYTSSKGDIIGYLNQDNENMFKCQRIRENNTHYSFNCTEELIAMEFTIDKDSNGIQQNRKMTCHNHFCNSHEELTITMIHEDNPLGFQLKNNTNDTLLLKKNNFNS